MFMKLAADLTRPLSRPAMKMAAELGRPLVQSAAGAALTREIQTQGRFIIISTVRVGYRGIVVLAAAAAGLAAGFGLGRASSDI